MSIRQCLVNTRSRRSTNTSTTRDKDNYNKNVAKIVRKYGEDWRQRVQSGELEGVMDKKTYDMCMSYTMGEEIMERCKRGEYKRLITGRLSSVDPNDVDTSHDEFVREMAKVMQEHIVIPQKVEMF